MKTSTFQMKGFLYSYHSIGILMTSYLPLFFFHQGLTNAQIGLMLSIGPIAALLAEPLSGYISDRLKTNKKVIIASLLGLLIFSQVLFQMNTFLLFTMIYFIMTFFMSPIGALSDSLAQKTANQHSVTFGSIRLWGSLGFAVTALIAGQWFTTFGIEQLKWVLLLFAGIAVLLSFLLSDVKVTDKDASNGDFLELVKNHQFLYFLLVVIFVTIAHRSNDSFISLYFKELGANESIVGWAWFIGVGAEVLMFALSPLWFGKLHELTLIAIAAGLYVVRFFLMGFIQDPMLLLFVQPTHGIAFAMFYQSAFQYVTRIVKPEVQSTGHVLLVTVFFGISGIIGGVLGGNIMENFSGSHLYYLLSISSFIGLIGVFAYKRAFRGAQNYLNA